MSRGGSFTIARIDRPELAAARPVVVDCLPASVPSDARLRLFYSEAPRKTKQVQLRGENDRIRLEGGNGLGSGPDTSASVSTATAFSYAVCLIDEADHTVDVIGPAERISLKRRVAALEPLGAPSAKDAPPPPPVDFRAAQAALGEAFGTKKRRQAIQAAEKNAIDMDRLQASSGAFIGRAIDATITSRLPPTPAPSVAGDSATAQIVDNGLLPPYCPTAANPADCYPMDRLIVPETVWMALPLFGELSTWKEALSASAFVLERVGLVINGDRPSKLQGERETRLFRLLYLHYLIALFRLKEPQLNNPTAIRTALHGLAPARHKELLGVLFEQIETAPGRVRYKLPQMRRDRLATVICALALHLDADLIYSSGDGKHASVSPMRTNATLLATAMGLTGAKVIQYFRAMGCLVEAVRGNESIAASRGKAVPHFATLKAPLVFPKPKLKR